MSVTPLKLIHVYCDESRQTGHRYMLLGGIWIPANREIEFNNLCHKFRSQEAHLATSFFKWGKATSKNFLKYYKQFIDLFFSFAEMRFNSIIIDTHQVDLDRYHGGDKELAFYKFYFFLLSRNIYPVDRRYLIMLDKRNDKKAGRLNDLKYRLNGYFNYNFSIAHEPIVNVEPRDCRLYNAMQLVDIFLGYLGYKKEGISTSAVKKELCDYIDTKRQPTPSHKFNVWEWKPSS